ncbi:hypothetical protein Q9233_010094 [Columba guinea]|nr:hypothetical protein Q9233_010094 [Columba guinea]
MDIVCMCLLNILKCSDADEDHITTFERSIYICQTLLLGNVIRVFHDTDTWECQDSFKCTNMKPFGRGASPGLVVLEMREFGWFQYLDGGLWLECLCEEKHQSQVAVFNFYQIFRLGERAFTFQLSQLNGRYHVLWDWKLLGDEELHFPRGKSAGSSAADEMGVSARRAALPRLSSCFMEVTWMNNGLNSSMNHNLDVLCIRNNLEPDLQVIANMMLLETETYPLPHFIRTFSLTVRAQTRYVPPSQTPSSEHIKERRNSSEVWITALLLLCTFALYVTLQEEQKDNEFNKKYP